MSRTRGASLIDTIVGVSLMLLVFVGVANAFQLSIELVSNNKARIGASALAQEQLEYIRSLSYDAMGVVGGIPAGGVPQTETVSLNGVTYTRRALIRYVDDPKDGLGAADSNGVTADSKEIKVEVSWQSSNGARTLALVSRASPPGIEQAVPGGTIAITVLNASLQPVSFATVRIVNASTTPAIDVTSLTNASGTTAFIGAPAATGYRITVSKTAYSSAQTYSADSQNVAPNSGHLTVSNNQTTSATFSIDLVSSKTVRTYKPIETLVWRDPFDDYSKISTTTNTEVDGGELQLAGDNQYPESGEVQSVNLGPQYLYRWKIMRFSDNKPPQTAIIYKVYYPGQNGPTPLPDAVLPGNAAGFTSTSSPLNISGVSTTTYPVLRLYGLLTTNVPGQTPGIKDWEIEYDHGPEPLGNIQFSMRGNKTIGADSSGNAIYKYNQMHTTNSSGAITLDNMEFDTHTITVNGVSIGRDIAESCLPQPRALAPAGTMETKLLLDSHTTNSLLADVKNPSGSTVAGATIRLYRASPAYNTTKTGSGCGQAFFSGLSSGTVGNGNAYSLDVSASGYQSYTSNEIEVSGASRASVILTPQ